MLYPRENREKARHRAENEIGHQGSLDLRSSGNQSMSATAVRISSLGPSAPRTFGMPQWQGNPAYGTELVSIGLDSEPPATSSMWAGPGSARHATRKAPGVSRHPPWTVAVPHRTHGGVVAQPRRLTSHKYREAAVHSSSTSSYADRLRSSG